VFEKEEPQCLSKEGKWSSPPAWFYVILCNCMTTKFIFIMLLHLIDGNTLFKDLPRLSIHNPWINPF
jgi:hypothetical protein